MYHHAWGLAAIVLYLFLGIAFYAIDINESAMEFRKTEAIVSAIFWLPIMLFSIFRGGPDD